MARLSVLAVLFFAAFPAWAQAQQPGWMADARTGCRVWNGDPQPKQTVTWSGTCSNRLAQGRGVAQWFEHAKPTDRYDGEYRDGKANGRGVYASANGDRYDGNYSDGKVSGRGVKTLANGGRYDGEWRSGEANGYGTFNWPNGDRYDGEWRNGKRSGRGVLTWANGNRYDGEWRDGKPNGRGMHIQINGDRYDGEWLDGKPNGLGTYTSDDYVYSGTWTNGCFRQEGRSATFGATDAECGFR